MNALLFDGCGGSVPPGAAPIDGHDLRQWPVCRLICECWPPEVGRIVLLHDAELSLDPAILADLVDTLDRGEAVALHGRDNGAVAEAGAAILQLLGGRHA